MSSRILVWTYWHTDDRPEIVEKCIASWKKHLDPDRFEIVVLSENTVCQYLSTDWLEQKVEFKRLAKNHQSDFVRLSLLKFYGGIWMDATIYLAQDLSFIEAFNKFYAPRFPFADSHTVQTWFLVAPKDDDTITKWLNLYIRVLQRKISIRRSWLSLSLHSGLLLRGLILLDKKFETYFQVYDSYEELYRNDAVFRKNTPRVFEYGVRARFRRENYFVILSAITLTALIKMLKWIDLEGKRRISRALSNRLTKGLSAIGKHKQPPSMTLSRNGQIILYKLNGKDRKALASDFRFE